MRAYAAAAAVAFLLFVVIRRLARCRDVNGDPGALFPRVMNARDSTVTGYEDSWVGAVHGRERDAQRERP